MKFILSLLTGLLLVSTITAQDFKQAEREKNYIALSRENVAKKILPGAFDKEDKKIDQTKNMPVPVPQTKPYVRPSRDQRFKRYVDDSFGIPAVLGAAFGAGIGFVNKNPPEWDRTTSGYAKRFASSYGSNMIRNTISFSLSEAFKLDNHFEKSGRKNIGRRLKHVFLSSYTTRMKNGRRIPDFPHFVGTYSASIIANEVWMPDRFSYKDGLRTGTTSLGIRFGVNLLREFIFRK